MLPADSAYPTTYYVDTAEALENMPRLEGEIRPDVCVIGAGITGLSAALYLAEQGRSVVVLEAKRIGWGATGRSIGHIHSGALSDMAQLEKKFGAAACQSIWTQMQDAKNHIEHLITTYEINCDYKKGLIQALPGAKSAEHCTAHLRLMQNNYHYSHLRFLSATDLEDYVALKGFGAALLDKEGARLHALNFTLGLAKAALSKGVKILERSRVREIEKGDRPTLKTLTGQVRPKQVIFACNGHLEKLSWKQSAYIAPIQRYAAVTEVLDDDLLQKILPQDYGIRLPNGNTTSFHRSTDSRLIFSTAETYGREPKEKPTRLIRSRLRKIIPELDGLKFDYMWGGTAATTSTGLPMLTQIRTNQFIAQGFDSNGLSMGCFYGKLLAEKCLGVENNIGIPSAKPFLGTSIFNRLKTRRLSL